MLKIIKWFVLSLLLALLAAGGTVLYFVNNLPQELIKTKISTAISQNADIEVKIKGDLDLSLVPSLAFTLNDINVHEKKNNKLLAHIKTFSLSLKLHQLWHIIRHIKEIDTVILQSPKIEANLTIDHMLEQKHQVVNLRVCQEGGQTKGTLCTTPLQKSKGLHLDLHFKAAPLTALQNHPLHLHIKQAKFDMHQLQGVMTIMLNNKTFTLRKGKATLNLQSNYQFDQLTFQGKYSDTPNNSPKLMLEKIAARFADGTIQGKTIYTPASSSLQADMTISGVNLPKGFPALKEHMPKGIATIQLSLQSNIAAKNIQQATTGNIHFTMNNAIVKGPNIEGLVKKLKTSKSLEDFLSLQQIYKEKVDIQVKTCQGDLHLKDSQVNVKKLELSHSDFTTQTTGTINLNNKQMSLQTSLNIVNQSKIPTLVLDVKGLYDNPIVGLNSNFVKGYIKREAPKRVLKEVKNKKLLEKVMGTKEAAIVGGLLDNLSKKF